MAKVSVPRILVVLFLPADAQKWLTHSEDELVLRKCAYWQSLRRAPATGNSSGVTVYLPKVQRFTPEALTEIASRLSRCDYPCYPSAV